MRTIKRLLALLLIAACSLPKIGDLPVREAVMAEQQNKMVGADHAPITRVPITQGMLVAKSIRQSLPADIGKRQITVSFPATESTLERLLLMVGFSGVRTAQRFAGNSNQDFLSRALPFRSFDGTLQDLMEVLRAGIGVVSWWQDGTLFLADQDRYALAVPQNNEVVQTIAKELEGLGAREITSSLRGGQIVFSASPTQYTEVISPYIERIHHNMAMVNIQLAVVDLALTDTTGAGFDWTSFSAHFSTVAASMADVNTSGQTSGAATTGATGLSMPTVPLAAGLSTSAKVFGLNGIANVAGAINILSKFGTTNTRQNVEVRTLSGTEVSLRSGQTIPYVSGVGVNALGGAANSTGNLLGSAQTSTVKTGLTIKLTPYFDSGSNIVTVALDVLVNSVLEFRQLSAGSQVGTLTQPVTQEQSLNDIVRVVAGSTVMIGGLQINNENYQGADPNFIRHGSATDPFLPIDSRSQDLRKEALFIILRPSVTVFVEQGG